MPQSSNKLSSFIGIILLLGIIGFTVFISFVVGEPIKEREKIEEVEKPKFRIFDSTDLANFWKLEKLHLDSVSTHHEIERTDIRISKIVRKTDCVTKKGKEFYTEEEYVISYGALDFRHFYDENHRTILEDVKMKYVNTSSSDSVTLIEIGKIIQHYQIQSIRTHPVVLGDFTCISLTDGRDIVLIKENTEIVSSEAYKKRIENAEYLNDSTRVIYPSY